MIIDTHCHVYDGEMENAEEIIKQAMDNDIHLILNGTDFKSNNEVLKLAEKYDNVHAALGYFYTLADEITDDDLAILDSQLENESVIAVGEIGLDYYHTKDNRDKQIELFENMLNLAENHNLPVIVHSRKAMQDTFDVLERHQVVGSLHCYQSSAEMAKRFIDLGFYIGVGGPVTNENNKKTRKTVNEIDISHILVETDSPYLPPQEKKGEMNTPLNIRYVTGKIAKELDMNEDEIIRITSENAKRLFKI
ncbi:TatD family hydrolase [uncultured Methanobrevibacter sp.]|uniref:TatD family hydrolase n=2 Tax=Methanobrevibacter TaxID=2172 RepID=UPI0025E7D5DD|nr:TatD family hydrolase [uncultured Methanobrevibacter sp.]